MKQTSTAGACRGSVLWTVLLIIVLAALVGGGVLLYKRPSPVPDGPAMVARHKVPPPPPVTAPPLEQPDDASISPPSPQQPEIADETSSAIEETDSVVADTPASAAPQTAELPTSAPPTSAPAQPDLAGWSVQVGAFRDQANALVRRDELNRKGYPAYIQDSPDGQQRLWHAVRIGPFESAAEATVVLERFKQEEKADAILVRGSR